MKAFIKVCRTTTLSALCFSVVGGLSMGPLVGQEQPPAGVSFQVVSVRMLSDQDAAERAPDFIGSNVAVRLRVTCRERGFYFFALKGAAIPAGYTLKLTDHGTLWFGGRSGEEKSSPGLQQLTFGMPGSWQLLPAAARPAIEWEELDSTHLAGERHARTIFIKLKESDKPIEIVSDPYVVPAGPPPAK